MLKQLVPKIILVAGFSCLGAYLLLRQRIWQNRPKYTHPKLQASLTQLLSKSRPSAVIKVAIVYDSANESANSFRSKLVDNLKRELSHRNITTLVNCSPQKLLHSSCKHNFTGNEAQEVKFIENALWMQYLIEDTISSIEMLKEKAEGSRVVMICDDHLFCVKGETTLENWNQLLTKIDITQSEMCSHYDIAFQLRDPSEDQEIVESMADNWKGFNKYQMYNIDPVLSTEQNIALCVKAIFALLEKDLIPIK